MITHYNRISRILLKQDKPISLDRLSLISRIPRKEITEILKFYDSKGFLKNKLNTERIELNELVK